jgi:hypothetical protein
MSGVQLPGCRHARNPHHVCTDACREAIAQQVRKREHTCQETRLRIQLAD